MNKIIKIIAWTILIAIICLIIYGFTLRMISGNICKKECRERGTFAYKVFPNSELNLRDICMCVYPDNKFESFIIK